VGVRLDAIARALREMPFVPGRLQRVGPGREFSVFVDYAHTDDALANVCQSLRPLTPGRLIVVFGCGGDRDRSKRPRMARAGAKLADLLIVTSDNPRSEDPGRIIDDILSGLEEDDRRRTRVQPDRALAIDRAVSEAVEGDVVLIAGKGHETTQVIGDRRIEFDDAAVALAALARRDDAGRNDRKEP
jgi:UDP-N-acetylmuramoyl-L-alanyl-D-glutamate--2,6-diaminopimelate ligase